MYTTQFLPLVIHHFKLSRLIRSVPLEFDSKSEKLILTKSRQRRRVSQFQSILTLMYFLVLLYNFLLGHLSMVKRLQGIPFVMAYGILAFIGWNVGPDIAPIQIINSILMFEKDVLQGTFMIGHPPPTHNLK